MIDPGYLFYYLGDPSVTATIAGQAIGATLPNLNTSILRSVVVRFPERLQVQRQIAEMLSTYDDLIEVNTRRVAILEEMARRLFDEWFVNFRFPGHKVTTFVDRDIGSVPECWQVAPAAELIEFDPKTKVPKDGEKPFIPMTSLSTGSMIIGDIELRSGNNGSKFQAGDTLFARITPCLENGKTGFVDFLRTGEVAFGSTEFIVMRGRLVSPEWVYLFARTDLFRARAIKSMSGATGRQRVRQESLKGFPIAIPESLIVETFTSLVRPLFEQVHVLAHANRNLRVARDLLLPKFISGEIDLTRAERSIESAADQAAAE